MKSLAQQRPLRSPAFIYRDSGRESLLHCDRLSLEKAAERFGTPLYVYSGSMIRERVRAFDRAFRGTPHLICYSVKANSNLSILHLLARLNCGFDVVSGGELERVLQAAPRAAGKVVFSGVGKTAEELTRALKAGILMFNVESEAELALLAQCAAQVKKTASIALRVNPDVPANTHPYISTGLRHHKFGIPMADAVRLYAEAASQKYLRVQGVTVHIGSQITDLRPFAAAMKVVANLVRELRSRGHSIRYVDAGGGLGIPYESASSDEFPKHAAAYAAGLIKPLRPLKVQLLLEPGRSIIGPAGALLTRVLYRKSNGKKRFVVVDAAMNDLLRPSLYGAYHEIVPVRADQRSPREIADVVGPICETGDFLARDRRIPTTSDGDLLAVLDAGAYGMSLASNYNSRLRPAEVLIEGKSAKLIRRRETLDHLLRLEKSL